MLAVDDSDWRATINVRRREMPSQAPDNAIETIDLCKTYRKRGRRPAHEALKTVSIAIPRGSMFALLGPNGAGKSTFINILAGLVVKTSGEARVWGADIEADMRTARRAIGVVPQELNIDPFFSPRELLEVQAGLYGVPPGQRKTDEILEAIGLTEQADAYARTLSGGMRRRLLVGKAMVHSPPVLVLDEPTAGVDIELRRQLWETVRGLNARGVTILLTTHYLEEAEELCDRVAIIDKGRLVACESKETLLSRIDSREMEITVDRDLESVPEALDFHQATVVAPRRLRFRYPPSSVTGGEILDRAREAGLGVVEVATWEAELEDIFLHLTGRNNGEGAH